MRNLHIEFFQGIIISTDGTGTGIGNFCTDVHVCDEKGRTVKVFPGGRVYGPRRNYNISLSERVKKAEKFIFNDSLPSS